MKITVKTGKFETIRTEMLAVFFFEGTKQVKGWLKDLDAVVKGRISEILRTGDFKGKLNESILLYSPDKSGIRRVLLTGMGKKKEFNAEKGRQVFGTAAKSAREKKLTEFMLCLTGIDVGELTVRELAQAAAEGTVLSLYRFTKFKTDDKKKTKTINKLVLFEINKKNLNSLRDGAAEGKLLADATCYARDLASYPGNIATPSFLAQEAKVLAKENGLTCRIYNREQMKRMKMNAILGVAQGSHEPPRFIVLEYNCGNKQAKTIALVGKGITFDAGGISLKPSKKMDEMKYDMCGAAAVLSVMKIIKKLRPKVNVIGIVAATENLPGGSALKPGDIITTYSGATVEIINTDAEGRLILSDALSYTVDKLKPDAVIDLATLTGACITALGHYATGMLGNNPDLINKVKKAGEKSGEMVWQLPLYPEFDEHIKSKIADIKNANGVGGGTILGAAFLKRFVGKTKWVHLDIAGTAWGVKEKSYLPKGPTGVGVRLLANLLKEL